MIKSLVFVHSIHAQTIIFLYATNVVVVASKKAVFAQNVGTFSEANHDRLNSIF